MPKNDVQDRFCRKYMVRVGKIEGGDSTPVQFTMVGSSWNCTAERSAEYGCKPKERAILVDWIPSGMQYTKPKNPMSFPEEAGVDKSKLPPEDQWVVFPRSFEGLPVYYKRGSQAWAL